MKSKTSKVSTESRLSSLEENVERILEILVNQNQNQQPNVAPKSVMSEAEREEMIKEQNEKLADFCKKHNLVAFEITGYSFKNNDAKLSNHSMTPEEKQEYSEIFDSENQIKDSGLASGKSIVTFVNVAEVQKVV
tara:strand:- start:81 stop:485 length:405 start_codon:yes stop_codon:yes gene_type:complete